MKIINQQANYALVESPDNIDISDNPPAEYLAKIRRRFAEEDWKRMSYMHALPEGWETMPYMEFLENRRKLMAQVIREGFESLLRR